MAERDGTPVYVWIGVLVFAGVGLSLALWDDAPHWLNVVQIALGLGLIALVVWEIRRRPTAVRGARVLLGLAAGAVLVAAVALAVSALR